MMLASDYYEMALFFAYPVYRSLTSASVEAHYNWLCYWACMTVVLPLFTLARLGLPCKLLWAFTLAANDAEAARWMVAEAARDEWLRSWRVAIERGVKDRGIPSFRMSILRTATWLGQKILVILHSETWQRWSRHLSGSADKSSASAESLGGAGGGSFPAPVEQKKIH